MLGTVKNNLDIEYTTFKVYAAFIAYSTADAVKSNSKSTKTFKEVSRTPAAIINAPRLIETIEKL